MSLQYTLAEALVRGALGRDAYRDEFRLNPSVLDLARRVHYRVDPSYPGPGRFKGAARIAMKDGRVFETVEEFNRGSREHPMSDDDLRAKFHDNASVFLPESQRLQLERTIERLADLSDSAGLAGLGCRR